MVKIPEGGISLVVSEVRGGLKPGQTGYRYRRNGPMMLLVGADSFSLVKMRFPTGYLRPPRLRVLEGEKVILSGGEMKWARGILVPKRHQVSIVSAKDD